MKCERCDFTYRNATGVWYDRYLLCDECSRECKMEPDGEPHEEFVLLEDQIWWNPCIECGEVHHMENGVSTPDGEVCGDCHQAYSERTGHCDYITSRKMGPMIQHSYHSNDCLCTMCYTPPKKSLLSRLLSIIGVSA